ncbi:hypothetical protein [Burkholderia ambifaria]|uniref:hypothetical protein n=1 Tax=Burkholderia ambifaria TaxID=152480 RepID=UPI00158ABACD|nr:hypothetical protein [Burkholderia ambifaria]
MRTPPPTQADTTAIGELTADAEQRASRSVSRPSRADFPPHLGGLQRQRRETSSPVSPADDAHAAPAPRSSAAAAFARPAGINRVAGAKQKLAALPSRIAERVSVSSAKRAIGDCVDFATLQPKISNGRGNDGATTITVGKRHFFVRTMALQSADGKGDRIRVIAERAAETGKSATFSGFHPVTANLTPDTTIELFSTPNGEWAVFGQQPAKASANWLAADAFDALNQPARSSGIVRIGTREFCEARLMTVPAIDGPCAPVVVERVVGTKAAADRYRLLGADLSAGRTIQLAGHAVSADPFETAIVAQLEHRWGGSPRLDSMKAAAIHAFRAGMPAHEAIVLAEQLASDPRTDLGADGPAGYAAAGASAGLTRRAGYDHAAAARVAQAVVRTAESMHSPGPDHATAGQLGAIAQAYDDATQGLASMRAAVKAMDRRALGPDLTAINTAARELFIEKAPGVDIAEAADAAAGRAIGTLQADKSRTEASLRQAEAALAHAHAQVAAVVAEQPPEQPVSRSSWLPLSLTRWHAPTTPVDQQDRERVAYEARLIHERLKLLDVQKAYEKVLESHVNAKTQVALVGDEAEQRLRRDVILQALTHARNAAPTRHGAAMIAARAASETFGADGDQAMARRAAATAHLAALGGATDQDSLVAAHLLAARWGAGSGEPTVALARQLAYAQVASAGIPAPGTRPAWTLAASAAAAFLGEHGNDANTTALLMGSAVTQPGPLPSTEPAGNDAFYRVIDLPPALPRPAVALPTFPAHYEAVESTLGAHQADPVDDWNHARIRQVSDSGFRSESGLNTITYIIEVTGERGNYWTNFEWSANANQLYGEVTIQPHGASADDTASRAKAVVAYNGVTGKWQSFEQRSIDLTAATVAALDEIRQLVDSRDDELAMTRLPYSGKDSGYMQNVVPDFERTVEEQVRLFVQGRLSKPRFIKEMANLHIDLANKLEHDRSRKKAIIRHQIDSAVRIASVLVGTGLGAARVAGAF